MFCTNCGAPNDDGARFCTSCGTPLTQAAANPAAGPAQAGPAQAGYVPPSGAAAAPGRQAPVAPPPTSRPSGGRGAGGVVAKVVVGLAAFAVMWVVGFLVAGGKVADLPVVGGALGSVGGGSEEGEGDAWLDVDACKQTPAEAEAALEDMDLKYAGSSALLRNDGGVDLAVEYEGSPDELPEGIDGDEVSVRLSVRLDGLDADFSEAGVATDPVSSLEEVPDDAVVTKVEASYRVDADASEYGRVACEQAEALGAPTDRATLVVASTDDMVDQAIESFGVDEGSCEATGAGYDSLRVVGSMDGKDLDGFTRSWSVSLLGEMDGGATVTVAIDVA